MEQGIIYFVGAGPGDPDLITLKAQRLISQADVILYAGSLVNPAILSHARPDATCYDSAGMKLDKQIALMGAAVRQGKTVVRLHTGDPSIYGAITEQMQALDSAGLPYRIVPGVSAAFAAAATLGIEYTLPGDTQTLILSRLAGQTAVPDSEALPALAAHRSSLVLFLSTGMIDRVVNNLRAGGYEQDTPIAVVFRASWPDEQVIRGSLADIVEKVQAAELTHQALIVVSPALRSDRPANAPVSHLYSTALDTLPRQPGAAIITLSRTATQTGRRLLERLPQSVLYAPQRFVDGEAAENIVPYRVSIRQVLQAAFQRHTALVCLMASGIAVRELAPMLRSKRHDPAVIVVDAAGTYAISLLGGHQGGANKLAQEVAAALGGTAVLTTSSDVQHLPAIDLLGAQYGWTLEDQGQMTAVCAALVNGDPVGVYQDAGDRRWFDPPHVENLVIYPSLEALQAARPAGAILITYRAVPSAVREAVPSQVVYHPRCLVVGVGCNRGTPQTEIVEAIAQTLNRAGLSSASIHEIVSMDAKADEPGLLAACAECGWPLRFFSRADLAGIAHIPNPSEWAMKEFGVPGVAEPAAMLGADTETLLVEKCRFANVTVAVARRKEPPS